MPAHSIVGLFIYLGVAMGLHAQVAEHSHPEFKGAALESFSYTPPNPEHSASHDSSADSGAPPRIVDPDVVVMNKVEVKSRFWDHDLAADIQKTRALKAESKAEFGTGVYQKDFGKARGSVATVLYVPIMVTVSW